MLNKNIELDKFPQLSNRGIIQVVPNKLFVDCFNYVTNDVINYSIDNLESISFLFDDFDIRKEFVDWLECNFQILFEIQLNYACTDKTKWPENRTFQVFLSWFKIYHSSMILDLMSEPIKVI